MLKLLGFMLALTARTGRGLLARARPRAAAALRAAKKSTNIEPLQTTNFEAAAASVVNRPQRLPLPAKTRKTVAFNQQYLCAGCGCLLPPEHEIDHIVPVALNGSDALSNLQALCKPCHQQKTRDQRHTILDAIKKEPPVVEEKEVKRIPPLKLNEQQRAAVEADKEPIRVVAGPGTGKTRVLTRRVAHLVESGARASSVLALTFTNRAANELRERLEQEINPQDASSISVGTFHRVCLTMLRDDVEALESPIRRGFAVYDQAAMIKLCTHAASLIHRRLRLPMTWVVFFSILSHFGPRRGHRRGVAERDRAPRRRRGRRTAQAAAASPRNPPSG